MTVLNPAYSGGLGHSPYICVQDFESQKYLHLWTEGVIAEILCLFCNHSALYLSNLRIILAGFSLSEVLNI